MTRSAPHHPEPRPDRALAVLALLVAGACGRAAAPAAEWSAARGDGYEVELGTVEPLRDAYLTRWYGRESPDRPEAELLGDERWALVSSTPGHFVVQLGASTTPRLLTTAVRRERADGGATLRAEVYFEADGGEPRSLVYAELAGDDDTWQELRAELPAEAGRLRFLARHAHPAMAEQPGLPVAWGAPLVAPAGRAADPDLPDVVLLSIDTLRAADFAEDAPRLHALVARGAYWPQAVAPSNWTLPAYASLLTGLDAGAHGAGRADFAAAPGARPDYTALDESARSFVETLRDAGYATCMVHQNPFLEPWSGLSRGFDRYLRVVDDAAAGAEQARAWWESQAHRPRLLVIHRMTPHLPYAAAGREGVGPLPDNPLEALDYRDFLAGDHELAERRAFFDLDAAARDAVRAHYRAEVGLTDRSVSAWLEPLLEEGWRAPQGLLYAFHADHGEELWEDGGFEHGHSFTDAVVRVPLGIVWPGHLPATRSERPVPVRLLGLEIVHLLGLDDRRLPDGCLLHALPEEARTSHPLYRAASGGRVYSADGSHVDLLFTLQGSGGRAPGLRDEVARRLAELGYAGRDEDARER